MYDLILVLDYRRIDELQYSVDFYRKNLKCTSISVITAKSARQEVEALGLRFVDEDKLMDGLTLQAVRDYIASLGVQNNRAAWYFQQFLKMGYSRICSGEYYVTWDTDSIPLRKITYFTQDGKICFHMRNEYHKPYFDTMARLVEPPLKKISSKSFISENMIFKKSVMLELLEKIESNGHLSGQYFWQKILAAVDRNELTASGFSEFELYGTYFATHYPDLCKEDRLKMERYGYSLYGRRLSCQELKKLDLDVIAFEKWDKNNPMGRYEKIKYKLKKLFWG